MKFILSFHFLLIANVLLAAEIGLISPGEAHRLIEASQSDPSLKTVVIDTRGGYKDYFRNHLPRAHHLNFDTLRGTDNGVPVQYLPDDLMRPLLVRAGVDRDRTHILYAAGDALPNDEVLSASMVAYVLEKQGVQDIRIVDGGLRAWQSAGLPVTQEYFGNPHGSLPTESNSTIAITVQEIIQSGQNANLLLVDARPPNEYMGNDDVWLRKGHIPGAINFHWANLMDSENAHQFRPSAEIVKQLEAAGITPDKDIVVYCGTSREGSLLRFYLTHVAKFPRVRLYEGSWKEYASISDLPAETSPSFVNKE